MQSPSAGGSAPVGECALHVVAMVALVDDDVLELELDADLTELLGLAHALGVACEGVDLRLESVLDHVSVGLRGGHLRGDHRRRSAERDDLVGEKTRMAELVGNLALEKRA